MTLLTVIIVQLIYLILYDTCSMSSVFYGKNIHFVIDFSSSQM